MDITADMNAWLSNTLYDGKPIDTTAQDAEPIAQEAGQQTSDDAPKLVISASSNGDGTFTVSGTGFSATDTAHLRCTDDKLYEVWGNAPTSGGRFTFTTGNVCMNPGGHRYFQANDGAANPDDKFTGTHWSNVVTITCDPAWATKPDDPDDPPDPPDPPADTPANPPADPPADSENAKTPDDS